MILRRAPRLKARRSFFLTNFKKVLAFEKIFVYYTLSSIPTGTVHSTFLYRTGK